MGHPAPNVLFTHSFRHFRPGEHVDEVRFSEPVVITACEILEQQSQSLCKSVSLTGVSSPLSFSVEIFVRSGGDARFKRFCHAFLYSASAPPLQDAQVAVTDHVVLRGTYHSLTLVLYGNHARGIGPVIGDHDLDLALADFLPEASCSLEDLPEELHPRKSKFGVQFSPLQYLRLVHFDNENIGVIRRLLQLAGQTEWASKDVKSLHKIVKSLVSASAYIHISESKFPNVPSIDFLSTLANIEGREHQQGLSLLLDAKKELQDLQAELEEKKEEKTVEDVGILQDTKEVSKDESFEKSESSDMVIGLILRWIQGSSQLTDSQTPRLFPVQELIGGLAAAQLLCTDAEECYRFVLAGGLHLLVGVLQHEVCNLSATTLLALGAVECISRYAFGCEGLLGWWTPDSISCGEKPEAGRCTPGYTTLVKFLMQPQQQPVVQLVARVLNRLRAYELTAAIQTTVDTFVEEPGSIVTSSVEDESAGQPVVRATLLIKRLLELLKTREMSGHEGLLTRFSHWLALDGEDVGTLLRPCSAYGATASTQTMNGRQDIDPFLLSVLQERRLVSMLVALISAPRLRSSKEYAMDGCAELVGVIEALLLALLSCRSGLLFLAQDMEVSSALLNCFQRVQELHEKNLAPMRHAVALSTAGFLCRPQDIGGMLQTCFSVMSAMDRLIGACGRAEESTWALWDLSAISRLESGRQALLMLTWFPEVMAFLVGALQPTPESPPVSVFGETLHRAAVHFVADVLLVVVSDAAASTVAAWTPHAVGLQRALLASTTFIDGSVGSSVGYEEKDAACCSLLEWLDSAVVYHKKGAIGLLKYVSGILAGGSAVPQNAVGLPLVDSMDVDANCGDQAVINDGVNVANPYQGKWSGIEALTSPISDTSTVQMTVAFRILALVSCYPGVAAVLYGEGAMGVVYSILEQCSAILHSSSSAYDALLDEEDTEFDRTGEDLGDHGKERLLVALLMPTLLFLLSLLQNVQAAVQNYQNTRLLDVLLSLHQQISSRIATYVSVPPYAWSGVAQEFVAMRHVLASVLVCWPIFGWTPSLLPRLFGVDVSSTMHNGTLLPMEPAVTCSVLALLVDMLPRESPQMCSSKSAVLDVYRSLAVDNILGVQSASVVSWHTRLPYSDKLMRALVPHLDQIGEIVSHHISTACVVLQDLLKLFIIRLACANVDHCATIVRLLMHQIQEKSTVNVTVSEKEILHLEPTLQMVADLALHPASKLVLLQEGAVKVLSRVFTLQSKSFSGDEASISRADVGCPATGCWLWIVRAFVALCDPNSVSTLLGHLDRLKAEECPSFADCCSVVSCLLNILQVIPFGKEFEVVLEGFETLSSYKLTRAAIGRVSLQRLETTPLPDEAIIDLGESVVNNRTVVDGIDQTDEEHQSPVFLDLWQQIRIALESEQCSGLVIMGIIQRFATSSLQLSSAGKSSTGVAALNCLFGFGLGAGSEDILKEEKLEPVLRIATILEQYVVQDDTNGLPSQDVSYLASVPAPAVQEAHIALMAMLRILKRPEIGKQMTRKALLVEEGKSATLLAASKSLQRIKLRQLKKKFTSLVSSVKLDSDSEKDFGSFDDSSLQLERDTEAGVMDAKGTLVWECSTVVQERPVLTRNSTKRKALAIVEIGRKRHGVEFSSASTPLADGTPANGAGVMPTSGRSLSTSTALASVLSRRDTFRQRKPNTSRPPSMHVDDYVARERSEVFTTGSSPAPLQRATSGSGRPPSIHVDEFMAKQQERQHPLVIGSGIDEAVPVTGRSVILPPVDPGRKVRSLLSPRTAKQIEDDSQIVSTPQYKEYEQTWEENAAVGPNFSNDSPGSASGPSMAANVRLDKTSSSSSSVSNATDSVHSVETPQVADMLLLQNKVTFQTAVARSMSGVGQVPQEEVLLTVSSSTAQQLQSREGSKLASKSSGTHAIPDKKTSAPFQTRTSELQSSSKSPGLVPPSKPQPTESHLASVSQPSLRHSLAIFSRAGAIDSAAHLNVFPALGSEQLPGVLPSDSQSSSISLLPIREAATPKRGMDPQGTVQGVSSVRGKGLSESTTLAAQKLYESQASGSTHPSSFTTLPHHNNSVMQMTSPRPLKEDKSVLRSATSNGPAKIMAPSSQATDPRRRPPEMKVERTAADISRPVAPPLPNTPWAADTTQSRLESAMISPLGSLIPAQPSQYTLLAASGPPGPQWPSGETLPKGASLARSLESSLPVQSRNARFVDETGVSYTVPGRSTQLPGNPPVQAGHGTHFHGAMQLPANFASSTRSAASIKGGVSMEGIPGPGPHTSPRERVVVSGQVQGYNGVTSMLQPIAYVAPPVPAGKPSAPHASSSPASMPAHQQLHMHFQQQNIIKIQQQQLQARQQHWQQQAQAPQMQQLHQQQLLGHLPMSVHVPVPVPSPSAAPSQQHSQQLEPSAVLQQMLASPDAIQGLLKDQNKLRELLEQHPKLISLLQERMSQAPP